MRRRRRKPQTNYVASYRIALLIRTVRQLAICLLAVDSYTSAYEVAAELTQTELWFLAWIMHGVHKVETRCPYCVTLAANVNILKRKPHRIQTRDGCQPRDLGVSG